MGAVFNKDGLGTFVVECLPGGGLITAPIHAAAGNYAHAAAAVAGAVLGAAIPGAGGAIAKGVLNGGKCLVVRQGVKVAAKVAFKGAVVAAGGGRALVRGVGNMVVRARFVGGVKKTANLIMKK